MNETYLAILHDVEISQFEVSFSMNSKIIKCFSENFIFYWILHAGSWTAISNIKHSYRIRKSFFTLTYHLQLVIFFQCTINRQVRKTMEMHDAMIRPPRCDSKAKELGMETGKNWRNYFYRDEAFYEA